MGEPLRALKVRVGDPSRHVHLQERQNASISFTAFGRRTDPFCEIDAPQHINIVGTAFLGMQVTLVTFPKRAERGTVQQCVHALSLVLHKPKHTICKGSQCHSMSYSLGP